MIVKNFLAVSLLFILTACGNTPIPTGDKFISVIKEAKPAIVQITYTMKNGEKVESGDRGTGFFIGKDLIATAKHVVDDPLLEYFIKLSTGGKVYPIRFIKLSEGEDVAICTVDMGAGIEAPKVLPLAQIAPPEGSEVVVMGYPLSFGLLSATGIISQNEIVKEDKEPTVALTAVIAPGNSGGPILDKDGKVVGIAVAVGVFQGQILPGFTLGVPVESLHKLMR